MSEQAPRRARPNVADVYRAGGTTSKSGGAGPQLQPLKPLQPTSGKQPKDTPPQPPAGATAAPAKARSGGRNPHAGKPTLSVRMPAALADHFDAIVKRDELGPLELALTAVASTLDELPERISADNRAREQGKAIEAEVTTTIVGGLFELPSRTSAAPSAPPVHKVWRTTQHNIDKVDEITSSLGARGRQQLLLLAITAYLEQKENA